MQQPPSPQHDDTDNRLDTPVGSGITVDAGVVDQSRSEEATEASRSTEESIAGRDRTDEMVDRENEDRSSDSGEGKGLRDSEFTSAEDERAAYTDVDEFQLKLRRGQLSYWFPITYSRVDRYKTCPQWYKFEYIDKLGRVSGPAADIGTVAHSIQELVAQGRFEDAENYTSILIPLDEKNRKKYEKIRAAVKKIKFHRENLYATEHTARWDWEVHRRSDQRTIRVQWEGKIDLLFYYFKTGTLEIYDGKSGANANSSVSDDPQGQGYGLGVIRSGELEPLPVRQVIFSQIQWANGEVVSAIYEKEKLERFEAEFKNRVETIVNDTEFRPTPGSYCHYCPFINRCPVGSKYVPERTEAGDISVPAKISDDVDAVAIGLFIQYLSGLQRHYKEVLKGYVRERGSSLRIGTGSYAFRRRSKRDADWSEIERALGKDNYQRFVKESSYPYFDFEKNVPEDQ